MSCEVGSSYYKRYLEPTYADVFNLLQLLFRLNKQSIMKISITLLFSFVFMFAFNFSANSQPTSCTPTTTGENATIVIPATAQLTLDGTPLPLGSHIIAMFNNNGVLTCGGYATWNGTATAMTVYGAEGGNPGFAVGEVYKFQVEKPGGCVVANATATYLTGGIYSNTNTYSNDGISGIATLQASPMKIDATGQNPLCNGGMNGTGSVVFTTNGITPYQYAWSNGQSTPTATSLAAGSYSVTVTDDSGCTATDGFTLQQPTVINVATSSTPAINGANNGTATAVASGGTPGYTYKWSTSPPITSATATGLAAGNYTITVTDNNGCTKTNSTTVSSLIDCAQSNLSIASVTDNGNGTATVNATGGSMPYSYAWSDGQTTKTATGLIPGDYTVTVTDANFCTKTDTVTVVGNPVPCTIGGFVWDIFNTEFGGSPCNDGTGCPFNEYSGWEVWAGDNFICDNFQAGGVYAFSICNGAGAGSWVPEFTILAPSGAIDKFGAGAVDGCTITWTASENGAYLILVNEAGACGEYNTIDNGRPALTCISNANCVLPCANSTLNVSSVVNNGNGTATVTATGGDQPYSYAWSNGQTTKTATGLTAGTYTVTVTDANGCTVQGSIIITVSSSHEIAALKSLDISPNPSSGKFTVQLELSSIEAVHIDIFDAKGYLFKTVSSTTAGQGFSFDLGDNPVGLYLLRIAVGDDYLTRKLVIID